MLLAGRAEDMARPQAGLDRSSLSYSGIGHLADAMKAAPDEALQSRYCSLGQIMLNRLGYRARHLTGADGLVRVLRAGLRLVAGARSRGGNRLRRSGWRIASPAAASASSEIRRESVRM